MLIKFRNTANIYNKIVIALVFVDSRYCWLLQRTYHFLYFLQKAHKLQSIGGEIIVFSFCGVAFVVKRYFHILIKIYCVFV